MKLKNFIKLCDENQTLLIMNSSKMNESIFVFDFTEKSYKNNYYTGRLTGKAYKDSEVIIVRAKSESILEVYVNI